MNFTGKNGIGTAMLNEQKEYLTTYKIICLNDNDFILRDKE